MNVVHQVELTSGVTKRVCWVDKNVKLGDVVTLKRDYKVSPELEAQLWEVTAVYKSTELASINRHWNNNI
jgi:hypothetical protein